jgi:gag-polypeptide of LTR copia-type
MAANPNNVGNLRSVLEKEKLTGNNFHDWYRNLRIVLKQEKKLEAITNPLPAPPDENATVAVLQTHQRLVDKYNDVACLMLCTMDPALQRQHENMDSYAMIESLKTLFQKQARHERYEVAKELFKCKLAEGNPVGPHVMKMMGHMETLERLNAPVGQELSIDLILQSLPESYSQFIMNFNMHEIEKTLPELLKYVEDC